MKALMRVAVFLGLLGLSACATVQLSEAGVKVKLMKSDPPSGCEEVSAVSAYSVGPNYQESLKNKLRNQAAEKGANYVRLDMLESNGNASGTAFKCKE